MSRPERSSGLHDYLIIVYMKTFCGFVVAVLMFDIAGFLFWNLSGQTPPDSFFIGFITAKVIALWS